MPLIREETVGDREAIRAVNRLAFGGEEEAVLVDRLRADGLAVASVLAVEGGEVAGHVLFSELPVETGVRVIPAVSLAPMAVRPEWQRKGIGSALVRAGPEPLLLDPREAQAPEHPFGSADRPGFSVSFQNGPEIGLRNIGSFLILRQTRMGICNSGGVVVKETY